MAAAWRVERGVRRVSMERGAGMAVEAEQGGGARGPSALLGRSGGYVNEIECTLCGR